MAKMRTRLKKLLAITLAVSMTMSLLSVSTLAAGGTELTVEVGATLPLDDKDGTTGEPEVVEAVEETAWYSSDETIATVDAGVVTGVEAGTVEITRDSYAYWWTNPEDPAEHAYYEFEDITDENQGDISPVKITTSWAVTVTAKEETAIETYDRIASQVELQLEQGLTLDNVAAFKTLQGDLSSAALKLWSEPGYGSAWISANYTPLNKRCDAAIKDVFTIDGTYDSSFQSFWLTYYPNVLSQLNPDGSIPDDKATSVKNRIDNALTYYERLSDAAKALPEIEEAYAYLQELAVEASKAQGWYFDEATKTLYITKSKKGDYWSWNSAPWSSVRQQVESVIVEDAVETLPENALGFLPNLKSVTIGSGLLQVTDGFDTGGWKCLFETEYVSSLEYYEIRCSQVKLAELIGNVKVNTLVLDNPEMNAYLQYDNGEFITGSTITADNLIIRNAASIGSYGFMDSTIQTVTIGNIDSIGNAAFLDCSSITSLSFTEDAQVNSIGASAFENCTGITGALTIPDSCTYIGDFAFSNCNGITELTIPEYTKLGYSNIFAKFPDLVARMEAILANQFVLGSVEQDDTLTVGDGWEDSHLGTNNTTTVPGTQVTKAARWTDTSKTQAEVQLQFSYTEVPGKDFLFVVDYSASMAQIGNSDLDDNSKFADMQSKLLDVSKKLLADDNGYNNRIAILSFSDKIKNTLNFTDDAAAVENFIRISSSEVEDDNTNPYGNTNFSLALQEAKAMLDSHTGPNDAVVIFISDGIPNRDLSGAPKSVSKLMPEISGLADSIKNTGTDIIGVLQSLSSEDPDTMELYSKVMETVSSKGLNFTSYDTDGFSNAVNDSIGAAFAQYVLTDVVNGDDFTYAGNYKITAEGKDVTSEFDVTYNEDNNTLTWDLTGAMPYTKYVLTFQENLKPDGNGDYPYGNFDTNEGNATVSSSGSNQVNAVATPVLSREETVTPTNYRLTVRYLEEDTEQVLADPYSSLVAKGDSYDATALSQKEISGYTITRVTGDALTGTMDTDKEILVWYKAEEDQPGGGGGGSTTYYDLIVRYLEEGTEKVLATAYSTRKVSGSSYDVTDRTEKEIDGYIQTDVTGDSVTGTMNSDKEIIVWYTSEEDIEDPDTPTTETPENPEDPKDPGTELPDGETPTSELPEEEVPKADVPATGDPSLLWLAASVLSGSGLAWLGLSERKGKREE